MSSRAATFTAEVVRRERLCDRLIRLVLGGPGLAEFTSTGIPDEWVALVVPGQFQSRYYTVRSWADGELVLDVVVHRVGLVTEWASRSDIVGETVQVSEPKGSFDLPTGAGWLYLVGDLTALPAMARISESVAPELEVRIWAEAPEPLPDYVGRRQLDPHAEPTWLAPPAGGGSGLAAQVETIDFPDEPGYFWMAGESAQMRAIRKHLMRVVRLPSHAYDVMGYWRGVAARQPRAVDPGPIYRAGKAAGLSDEQIWQRYDEAQGEQARQEQQ
ncbi:MAG: siderophore-interacting protein [Nocardioides sp.]|uniref:siderophore-interacting protein n=1 Tax=Nocardioides sp. TaxID=35761 RepID=UPI0039E61333